MPAAQALVAMTSRVGGDARRGPCGSRPAASRSKRPDARVLEDPHARRRARRAAARAPAPPAARSPRSARARRRGATRDPERRAISSGASRRNGPDAEPLAERDDALPGAHLRRARSPSRASPACRKCASIPCARRTRRSRRSRPPSPRATRTASASPHSATSEESFGHQDSTNPPLRPDAPPPQMSCSSTTTSQAGSSRLIRGPSTGPT